MKKRKGPKTRPVAPAAPPPAHATQLVLEVTRLEIARGYDGLFRGEPEPVLVFGVFMAGGLSNREQLVFTKAGSSPRTLTTAIPNQSRTTLTGHPVTLVCIALEEDSGESIKSVYSALSRDVRTWLTAESIPQPLAPHEVSIPEVVPHEVELLFEGSEWRATVKDDDAIAASIVRFGTARSEHDIRIELRSPDGKNEWTACVHAELR